jgi:Fe-S cluster assembly iron-binding protein IscA
MLTMTEAAGAHLSGLLGQVEAPDEAAVRIVIQEQGLSLQLDTVKPDDETFEHEGNTVLVLDKLVAEAMAERTLDIEQVEGDTRLAIT